MMRWPNDWPLKNCLWACGGVTLLQAALVALSQLGVNIPVIQPLNGFIFLTFVPGILLLRILRVHAINMIESLAYSAGLSLALVMFSGALANFVLPLIGIAQPLRDIPILVCLLMLVAVLAAFAWLRDRQTSMPDAGKIDRMPDLNSMLFLLLIPLLVILGVKIGDLTGNSWMLIISLLILAAAFGLGASKKFIKPSVYPLAIFVLSLSLLYQSTLMSPLPVGTDIYTEYQFYNLAAIPGVWDNTIAVPINSCLSIVILGPYYSNMLGISGIWVFKAVYPLLFSLMPLALYRLFRIQTGQVRAFLAAFFFMAVPTFSLELIALCRQQVAELFMALFILLLVERRLGGGPKLAMLMLFAVSIAVSHYALGFINLVYTGLLVILVLIMRGGFFRQAWAWLTRKTGGLPDYIKQPGSGSLPLRQIVIPVAVYFVLALGWYFFIAGGINFYIITQQWLIQTGPITQTLENITSLAPAISAPASVQAASAAAPAPVDQLIRTALGLDFWQVSWQGKLFRLLQYVTQLFIIAGCFRLLFRPRGLKFSLEYMSLCVTSVLLLAAVMILPYMAYMLNASRWYHISLITLAPFCILGGEAVFTWLQSAWKGLRKFPHYTDWETENRGALLFTALAVLVPYFIFTSGIVYELTQQQVTDRIDSPYSLALSNGRLNLTGIFNDQDGYAARWMCSESAEPRSFYSDANSYKMTLLQPCTLDWSHIPRDGTLPAGACLYLTAWNNDTGKIAFSEQGKPGLRQNVAIATIPGLQETISAGDRVYVNGGPVIYFTGAPASH